MSTALRAFAQPTGIAAIEIRKPPFGGFLVRSRMALRRLRLIRATLACIALGLATLTPTYTGSAIQPLASLR